MGQDRNGKPHIETESAVWAEPHHDPSPHWHQTQHWGPMVASPPLFLDPWNPKSERNKCAFTKLEHAEPLCCIQWDQNVFIVTSTFNPIIQHCNTWAMSTAYFNIQGLRKFRMNHLCSYKKKEQWPNIKYFCLEKGEGWRCIVGQEWRTLSQSDILSFEIPLRVCWQ